ncbi:Trp biosynthesis-associated membrane protein [Nocardioides sp. TRM66260-LWL]|uniref:Trp biosynthesis-associated membrane protein n=1 Tax=Nocardioides sp. TRM66260-LWL TaxID=2874478 RepID=UPI001CC648E9|nr:Trp biosynthesis-associated membrane protein [Nocardioides sp. TRM66260-LWL]MBZ5733376.1 Trp biosynthesis-associated membrane protein [Nocardioides sp. TRM66260-LWL]
MRRSFGLTVLLGLASGTLVAVAGSKPWVTPVGGDGETRALASFLATGADRGELPVATSLALVVLACWGVVLVTRGRVRRAVTVLGAVAAAGTVVAVVDAWLRLADRVREDVGAAMGEAVSTQHTAWSYAGSVGVVVMLLTTLVAVRSVGSWPEMGTRYDTPTGAPAGEQTAAAPPEERSNLELWRSIDAGDDPTA